MDVKIGMVTHTDQLLPQVWKNSLQPIFANNNIPTKWLDPLVKTKQGTVWDVRNYLAENDPNVLFLEANFGSLGSSTCSFPLNFFTYGENANRMFVLFSDAEISNVQELNALPNVQWISKSLGKPALIPVNFQNNVMPKLRALIPPANANASDFDENTNGTRLINEPYEPIDFQHLIDKNMQTIQQQDLDGQPAGGVPGGENTNPAEDPDVGEPEGAVG